MKEEFEAFYYVIITVNGEVDICMPAHELVEQGLVVSEWDPFF